MVLRARRGLAGTCALLCGRWAPSAATHRHLQHRPRAHLLVLFYFRMIIVAAGGVTVGLLTPVGQLAVDGTIKVVITQSELHQWRVTLATVRLLHIHTPPSRLTTSTTTCGGTGGPFTP